nr:hypothetical protein BDOA9_0124780 [Bradyrhizobium sp. DOA9]
MAAKAERKARGAGRRGRANRPARNISNTDKVSCRNDCGWALRPDGRLKVASARPDWPAALAAWRGAASSIQQAPPERPNQLPQISGVLLDIPSRLVHRLHLAPWFGRGLRLLRRWFVVRGHGMIVAEA